jgi:hypothetical protein
VVQATSLLEDLQALALASLDSLARTLEVASAVSGGAESLQKAAKTFKSALLEHHSASIAHVQVRPDFCLPAHIRKGPAIWESATDVGGAIACSPCYLQGRE